MPVRPDNKARYPPDWKQIAREVKDACGWVCEFCSMQCRRPGEAFDTHRRTMSVAHLDHTPENCDRANLRGLCSACHLRYDARHHAASAARTRRSRKACGDLFDE